MARQPPNEEPPRQRGRTLIKALIWTVAVLVAIPLLLLLLLQFPAPARWAAQRLVAALPPFRNSHVEIGRVRGSWITSLELHALTAVRGDTLLLAADTLRLSYSTMALLRRRVVVNDVVLRGGRFVLAPGDTTKKKPPGPKRNTAEWLTGRFYSGMPIRVNRISIARSTLLRLDDSTGSRADDIRLEARHLALGGGPATIELDTLGMRIRPPGPVDRTAVVGVSGSLNAERLELRTLGITSDSSRVTGAGTVRLLRAARDSIPDAELALDAAPLDLSDLALFSPRLDAHGRVEAHVKLRGADPQSLQGSIQATTTRAQFGGFALGPTTADVRLARGRVDFDTRATTLGIRIASAGWLAGTGPAYMGHLTATIDTLPAGIPGLPAWDRTAPRSAHLEADLARGNAHTVVTVRSGAERLALEGDLDLRRLPALVMRRGSIARLDDDAAEIAGGSLAFDSVRVSTSGPGGVRASGLRLDRVDLAGWLGVPEMETAINGTANGEYRWSENAGRLRIAVDTSMVRGQRVDGGTIEANFRGETLAIESALEKGATRLALEGSIQLEDEPVYSISSARFQHLDIAPWTGNPAHLTDLTGNLAFEGTAGDSGFRALSGTVALERSSGFGLDISSGRATGRWSPAAWSTQATLGIPAGGDVNVDASSEAGRLRASGKAPLLALLKLAGHDSLTASGEARFDLDLSGIDPRTASGYGAVSASGRIGEAAFDSVVTRFHAAAGVFDVDTLIVGSNAVTAAGSGPLALFDTTGAVSDFHAGAAITNAGRLAGLLGVDSLEIVAGRAAIDVRGPSNRLAFNSGITATTIEFPGLTARGVNVQGRGVLGERHQADSLGITGTLARFETGGLRMNTLRFGLRGATDSLAIDLGGSLGSSRRLETVATLMTDSTTRRLVISSASFGAKDDPWVVKSPAEVRFGPEWIAFDHFEARSDSGSASLDGMLTRNGTLDFTAAIQGASIRGLTEWTGREDLQGHLDLQLRVQGSAAQPLVTGEMTSRLRAGRTEGVASAKLDWKGPRMDLDAAYRPAGNPPIEVTAELPLVLSLVPGQPLVGETDGEVKLRVDGRGVALASLSPFFDPKGLALRAGTLDLDLALGGTSRDIRGSGGASLREGAIDLPGLGVSYEETALEMKLEGRTVEVGRAFAATGKGSIETKGKINLERLSRATLDFDIRPQRFQAVATRDQNVVLTGALKLTGTPAEPVMTGNLTVESTELYLTQATTRASEVPLTDADIAMLEEHFGDVSVSGGDPALGLYDAARLDLDVKLGGAVWIRQRVSPRIAAKLEGSFKMVKEPHGEPLLTGRVWPTPRRGFVEEFARQFDFDEGGEVRLNGAMEEHDIDLKAVYRIEDRDESGESQVVVRLDVQGRLNNLKLILSSEPAMEQSEIINYIITGKSLSETSQGMGAGAMAAQVGLSMLTAGLEDYAQRAIGLDVVQVRQDGLQGTTLIAGRYMSPELYVGFRQPVTAEESGNQTTGTANRTQYELEYSAYQWLTLNLLAETSKFRSFFRARHAY